MTADAGLVKRVTGGGVRVSLLPGGAPLGDAGRMGLFVLASSYGRERTEGAHCSDAVDLFGNPASRRNAFHLREISVNYSATLSICAAQ